MPFSGVIGYFFRGNYTSESNYFTVATAVLFCKEIEQKGKFEFEMKIPYKANVNPQVSIQIPAGSSIDCRNTFKWKKVGAFNVYEEK